jgi:L-aspartate oxidase
VYLDATHMGERFHERFPSITEACREIGLDPAVDRIPVAPAAHYACGGIRAGLDGSTSLRGLYAVGEVSSTGVHGANRLASNSLTEGVVAGTRLGRDLAWELPDRATAPQAGVEPPAALIDAAYRAPVRAAMSRHVGVLRDTATLDAAAAALDAVIGAASIDVEPTRATFESTNLTTVARAMVAAAAVRTESRGCHRRTDHADPRDEWRLHLDVTLGTDSGQPMLVRRDATLAVAGQRG